MNWSEAFIGLGSVLLIVAACLLFVSAVAAVEEEDGWMPFIWAGIMASAGGFIVGGAM